MGGRIWCFSSCRSVASSLRKKVFHSIFFQTRSYRPAGSVSGVKMSTDKTTNSGCYCHNHVFQHVYNLKMLVNFIADNSFYFCFRFYIHWHWMNNEREKIQGLNILLISSYEFISKSVLIEVSNSNNQGK